MARGSCSRRVFVNLVLKICIYLFISGAGRAKQKKKKKKRSRALCCLLAHFPTVSHKPRLSWGGCLGLGTRSQFPVLVPGTRLLVPSLLFSRVFVSRKRDLGTRAEYSEFKHLSVGCWPGPSTCFLLILLLCVCWHSFSFFFENILKIVVLCVEINPLH